MRAPTVASLALLCSITGSCTSTPPHGRDGRDARDARDASTNAGAEDGSVIDEDAPPATPWRQRRARPTSVPATARSPWAPPVLTLDETMERVRYRSESGAASGAASGDLLAVIARPPTMPVTADTPTEKLPGVVLLHNGFALTNDTLAWARPFLDEGFAVLLPSYRGENGNPGAFELLRGEVDDVKAATRMFVAEPDVDVNRLYVFGHSAGGGLVSLLALDPDVPFRILATSNGLYSAGTFTRWKRDEPDKVPFDVANLDERTVRALVPNAHELVHPLTVLVGDQDTWVLKHTEAVKARAPRNLVTVHVLKGDHMGSLPAALARFKELVVADAFGATARPGPSPAVSRSAPSPTTSPSSARHPRASGE